MRGVTIGTLFFLYSFTLLFSFQETVPYVTTPADIVALFPKSIKEIDERKDKSLNQFRVAIRSILAIEEDERTFENTIIAWDRASGALEIQVSLLHSLSMVSPEKAMREKASNISQEMEAIYIECISNNEILYRTVKNYTLKAENEQYSLTDQQWYYLTELISDFEDFGLALEVEKREKVKQILQKLTKLSQSFSKNIRDDNRFIFVSENALSGVNPDLLNVLSRDDQGLYKVTCDYPVYIPIMSTCVIEETRRKLYEMFSNRAYPQNVPILNDMISQRDRLAKELGYESYAQYELNRQMVQTPENAELFLNGLIKNSLIKEEEEFISITKNLPDGVTLSNEKKIKPWDVAYIHDRYKKKYYNLDDEVIAQYFPMDVTIRGLIGIYEQFFNLKITEMPIKELWHNEARLLKIENHHLKLLAFIILDLFPRESKYSHACDCPLIPALKGLDGRDYPAVSLLIMNFPKATSDRPSLLEHREVQTFFHEFGHAIHDVLGRTKMIQTCGTRVKRDFVELPSQILEEWLWDRDILHKLSGHYQTKKPLPDELIDKMFAAKNYSSGMWVQRQCLYSMIALNYFKEGETKDADGIVRHLKQSICPHYLHTKDTHFQLSFGHLDGYGSRYYGYLWSKVFALDIFQEIKRYGLLNPEVGEKYVNEIIGKGGSEDPNRMLRSFLGREPDQKAFFQDLGIQHMYPPNQE